MIEVRLGATTQNYEQVCRTWKTLIRPTGVPMEGLPTLSVTCYLWLSDRQLSSSDATGETEVTKLS